MRKMNMHPDMPQPSVGGDSLSNFHLVHDCKFRSSYTHIPKQRWEEIFGKKPLEVDAPSRRGARSNRKPRT